MDVFEFYVQDNRSIAYTTTEPIMLEDSNVTRFSFRIPKTINNIDMTGYAWWFVYVNAANTEYSESLTLEDDEDDPDNYSIATYDVTYGLTGTAGTVRFALEAIYTNSDSEIEVEWHTLTYKLRVYDTLQGNEAEYSETESDVISALIVAIQEKYNALVGGAVPTPVSSTDDMTDTTTIYLNTTDGNWYYYDSDNSAWVSGGAYASGITVDSEMSDSSTNPVQNAVINAEISALKEDYELSLANIATVESTTTASQAYAVGDLLVYDGTLYTVTTAIASGDTIEVDTNVEATTVETEIASLEEDLDTINDLVSDVTSDNLFSTYTNYAYWKSDGTQVTNYSWIATDAIDVSAYESITYENAGSAGSTPVCLWTGSNDDVVSTFYQNSAGETLEVPDGAVYVKFSLRIEQKDSFSVVGSSVSQITQISETLEKITEASQDVSAIATFATGGINTSYGTYNSSYTWRIATSDVTTISEDYTLRIADGYRLYVVVFEDGTFSEGYWVGDSTFTIEAGSTVRLMVALTSDTEDESVTADVDTFCAAIQCDLSINVNNLWQEVEEVSDTIKNINAVNVLGQTWDWWISSLSVDDFGNVYIGYVDSEGYSGVLRRQPDGTTQYKRLEKLSDNDDHNGPGTLVLDDGRILVMGSYGHSASNYFICWRSTEPYSIDEMEKLSFSITQSTYSHRTTYSQLFKYNGVIFDFFRIVTYSSGTYQGGGYACHISTDNGDTWTTYKVFYGTDGYQAMAQCTDDDKYVKIISAINPSGGSNVFRGCYIDLSTYKIYDLSGTEIGEMVELGDESIVDDSIVQKSDMTSLIAQTEDGLVGRLFCALPSELADTVFLYATAIDTDASDFTYKRYNNGTVTELGTSGVGFGNVHYISGACFGNSEDTVYYSKATTSSADGNHELHKVKISSDAVASDDIITEASMCILRPLFLGNGEIATVVGHYNDQNDDGTYNGSFTVWELKPFFTRA